MIQVVSNILLRPTKSILYFYDGNVPLYKLEYKDGLKHERCKQMIRTDTYTLVKSKWNEFKDVNDNDFKPLVDTIINSDQSSS